MWNPCSERTAASRVATAALFVLLAACGRETGEVKISDAWVRAVPPTSGATAAYFTLVNQSAVDLVIVGASSSIAARVEMHEMTPVPGDEQSGAARMQRLERLRLAPGESTTFETGGRHLMLMDMETAPLEGDTVEICLITDEGEELCQYAPVRRSEPGHQH